MKVYGLPESQGLDRRNDIIPAVQALARGQLKVYGLPESQGLDRRNDIIPAVQALARGQSINLHLARS